MDGQTGKWVNQIAVLRSHDIAKLSDATSFKHGKHLFLNAVNFFQNIVADPEKREFTCECQAIM